MNTLLTNYDCMHNLFCPGVCAHAPPCRAFRWLPVYNFGVMLLTLAYQAPFEQIFDWRPDPDQQASKTDTAALKKLGGGSRRSPRAGRSCPALGPLPPMFSTAPALLLSLLFCGSVMHAVLGPPLACKAARQGPLSPVSTPKHHAPLLFLWQAPPLRFPASVPLLASFLL